MNQTTDQYWGAPPPYAPKKKGIGGKIFLGIAAFFMVMIMVAAANSPDDTASATSKSSSGGSVKHNSKSRLACTHFRNVGADAGNGLLSDYELRKKLKEVYDNSAIASPNVEAAAMSMLRAITQNDSDLMRAGVTAMDTACRADGF